MGNVELKKEHKKPIEKLKREVSGSKKLITKDIKSTVESMNEVLVISYEDLEDLDTVKKNIESLFQESKAKSRLVEAATAMFTALRTTTEMKGVERNYHRRLYSSNDKGQVYGVEMHYAVRGIEESRTSGPTMHTYTELAVAYKIKVHLMAGDPKDYPQKSEYDALEF